MITFDKQNDIILIKQLIKVGYDKLKENDQRRWQMMMILNDDFQKEFEVQKKLNDDIDRILSKNVVNLKKHLNKIHNKFFGKKLCKN